MIETVPVAPGGVLGKLSRKTKQDCWTPVFASLVNPVAIRLNEPESPPEINSTHSSLVVVIDPTVTLLPRFVVASVPITLIGLLLSTFLHDSQTRPTNCDATPLPPLGVKVLEKLTLPSAHQSCIE